MAWFHPAAVEHRRRLFTRPDGQNYLRDDPHRVGPPTPQEKSWAARTVDQMRAEEAEAARAAEIAAFEPEHRALRDALAELKDELAWRALCRKYGFNPDQPRDERRRWTDAGGTPQDDSSDGPIESESDSRVLSDETADAIRPGAQYVQNESRGRPIDLREEQQLGGHAIEGHVGKSEEFLLGRVRTEALDAERDGYAGGLRVGSFPSLEAANKLVNATVGQNPDKIERITSGQSPREELVGRFDSITGYESYARNERTQPYIRDTNGVIVVAVPDQRVAKGYRVDTAFPVRLGR